MDLSKYINDLTNKHGFEKIKELESLSFGEKAACKEFIISAFNGVDKTIKVFKWLPEYDEVVDWMNDSEGKGLFLTGSSGRGKSILLNYIIPLAFYSKYKKILHTFKSRNISKMDQGKFDNFIIRQYYLIDEIGREKQANEYGVKHEFIEYVIDECETKSKLIFMTTNFTKEQIIARYGVHIWDRIRKLCRIVVFRGESYR